LPVVSCYCEKCGESFYLKDELYIPLKASRFKITKDLDNPKTWQDWLLHISAFCVNCRKPEIPEKCWDNYLKLKGE
jgi:hypothetical protein